MVSKKLAAITVVPLSLGMAALVLCVTARAVTAPSPTLIAILQAELNREFTGLKAKADPAPYYMAYEVTDEETGTAAASLGAVTLSQHSHGRVVDTTIRVGSPQFDNYHSFRGDSGRFTVATLIILDNNPDQIRQAL